LNELEVRYTNNQPKIIATSNVMKTEGAFDFVLNYRDLIDPNTEIIDNSLVMILKVLALCHVRDVYLAGFDGYSKIDDNYLYKTLIGSISKEESSSIANQIFIN